MDKFEVGKRYLVRSTLTSLHEAICIEVTEKHVKLRWENKTTSWNSLYDIKIVESLPDIIFPDLNSLINL